MTSTDDALQVLVMACLVCNALVMGFCLGVRFAWRRGAQ